MIQPPEIDILKAKKALAKAQKKELEYFQLEAKLEEKIVKFARNLGVVAYKFTSPSKRSVPDRIFIFPGNRVVFIEMKRLGEKPTDNQWREINKLIDQGAEVYVCDSSEVGKMLIETIYEEQTR